MTRTKLKKNLFTRGLIIALCFIISFTFIPFVDNESSTASAATSIEIGDYVQMGTYYGEPILWRCVDIDENGPLMLSDKILCLKAFDASGDVTIGSHGRGYTSYNTKGYDRQSVGSNCWEDSNIRCWLNSTASAGNVEWTCGNKPDESHVWLEYNEYDKEAGFLTNFTQSERNCIKSVSQYQLLDSNEYDDISSYGSALHTFDSDIADCVTNFESAHKKKITDTMFLLDVRQVNKVYQNGEELGDDDYYKGKPTAECVEHSEYESSYLAEENYWSYWLRSPSDYNYFYFCTSVRYVSSDSYVYCDDAYIGMDGVRPAFYLNTSTTTFISGDGSEDSPYTVAGGSVWDPEDNPSNDYVHKTGNFTSHFPGSDGTRESLSVYYDDNLFSQAANKYNHRLAQYSLAMALAGFTANSGNVDWSKSGRKDSKIVKNRMQNINEFYDNLGYKDATEYNYEYSLNETSDKVAFSMARKVIKNGNDYDTVISVILRGEGYGAEWGSNFNVGSSKYHSGWDTASNEVYSALKTYISTLKSDGKIYGNVKLHITGYSRSAAVANILAGKIDNNYSEFTSSKDNIYAYTFATPCGVNKNYISNCNSSSYGNIFNIINTGDVVPRVAMNFWGYARYGVNKYFNINASKSVYNSVTNYRKSFCDSTWDAKKNAKQTADVEDILEALYCIAPNISYYTPGIEYAVKDLMAYNNSRTNSGEEYISLYSYCMNKYGVENIQKAGSKASPYYSKLNSRLDLFMDHHLKTKLLKSHIEEYKSQIQSILHDMLVSMVYHGMNPETAYQKLRNIIDGVDANYFKVGSVADIFIWSGVINSIPDWLLTKKATTTIVEAHQSETYVAWMNALGSDDTNVFGNYSYNVTTLKMNALPVVAAAENICGNDAASESGISITIYDQSQNEVCKIVNGEVISCEILNAEVREDGSIRLCTIDGIDQYSIKISSNSSKSVSLTSSNKDLEGNEAERVVYDELMLNDKTVVTGEISGDTLHSDNGVTETEIEGEVLTTEDLNKYTISAAVEGSGTVNSVSAASYGDEIALSATPIGNASFTGWFNQKSNVLISNEAELTLTVKSDINVVAKFETLPVTLDSSNAFHLVDEKLTGMIYVISGKDINGTVRLSVLDSGGNELCKDEKQVELIANNTHSISYNMDLSQYSDVKKIKAEFISDSKTVSSYEKDVESVAKHNYKDESVDKYSNSIGYTCYSCADCGFSHISGYTNWGNFVDGGDCGVSGHESDVAWSLYDSGNLIISGNGSVKEYEDYPWSDYYDQIETVRVDDKTASLGNLEKDENLNNAAFVVDESNANYSSVDGVLFNKDGSQLIKYPNGKTGNSYALPDTVTKVCDEAFKNNTALTSIVLDENLTEIGKEAFCGCTGITEITIPSNVTTIGDSAFEGCSNLTKATFKGTAPTSFGESVFGGTEDLASGFTIVPPEDLTSWKTDKYDKTAGTWNGYKIDITEDEDDESGSFVQKIFKVFKSLFSSFKSIFSKLFGFLSK